MEKGGYPRIKPQVGYLLSVGRKRLSVRRKYDWHKLRWVAASLSLQFDGVAWRVVEITTRPQRSHNRRAYERQQRSSDFRFITDAIGEVNFEGSDTCHHHQPLNVESTAKNLQLSGQLQIVPTGALRSEQMESTNPGFHDRQTSNLDDIKDCDG